MERISELVITIVADEGPLSELAERLDDLIRTDTTWWPIACRRQQERTARAARKREVQR
jgi:hypothetical protein